MITRSIKIKEEQLRKLQKKAKKDDRSVAWIIREAIDDYLEKNY